MTTGRRRVVMLVALGTVGAVALAALGVFVAGRVIDRTPGRRDAVTDAAAVAEAVAAWVARHGTLPRVTVPVDADGLWGDTYLVEDVPVPQSDPDLARMVVLAGTAERWCVETTYHPPSNFLDAAPVRWVSLTGAGADHGEVRHGRCPAEWGLHLPGPVATDGPAAGSVVTASSAPAGTCLAHPFTGESAGGDATTTGEIEVRACAEAHFGEIFHTEELPEGPFDHDRIWTSAAERCDERFPQFIGVPHNVSALVAEAFVPSAAQWAAGQRTFTCLLYPADDYFPLHGSARDSWR